MVKEVVLILCPLICLQPLCPLSPFLASSRTDILIVTSTS